MKQTLLLALLTVALVSCEARPIPARSPETDLWGYLNGNFEWIGEPEYQRVTPFSDGVSIATFNDTDRPVLGREHRIIGLDGDVQGKFRARDVDRNDFGSNRILALSEGGSWFFVDFHGTTVLQDFERATGFSEGLAFVYSDGQGRYISPEGNAVFETDADMGYPFRNGVARVRFDNDDQSFWGLIDRNGSFVLPPEFANAIQFSEGLAAVAIPPESDVRPPKMGYVDENANWVINPEFYNAHSFVDGVALVQTDAPLRMNFGLNSQLLDRTGRVVVDFPANWSFVFSFQGGFTAVAILSQGARPLWGIVDTTGEPVVPFRIVSEVGDVLFDGRYWHLLDRDQSHIVLFDTMEAQVRRIEM